MTTSSHPPEVLRDLAARLRRQWRPPPATSADPSGIVHELTREELAAAVDGGVLELDHATTHRWGLVAFRTSTAKNGRVMHSPIGAPTWA